VANLTVVPPRPRIADAPDTVRAAFGAHVARVNRDLMGLKTREEKLAYLDFAGEYVAMVRALLEHPRESDPAS
jgi:hypothetical protein